jgi:hypothetical protein
MTAAPDEAQRPPAVPDNPALRGLLASFRGRGVAALLLPGNRGDGVVHAGGRRLFAECGLSWSEFTFGQEPPEGEVLLVFANGALHGSGSAFSRAILEIGSRYREVVLLPGTFDAEQRRVAGFLGSLDARHTVFCRERESFARVGRLLAGSACRIHLGHDLAFHADLSAWAARPAAGEVGIFRGDRERSVFAKPEGLRTVDASDGPMTEPEGLLEVVSAHAVIHTDRCHAAICGARMGRRVHLHPNSYFKNRAIHAHSLAGFPNVVFMEDAPFSAGEFAASGGRRVAERVSNVSRHLLWRMTAFIRKRGS